MSQKLSISAIYLIATIFLFLVICEATSPTVENRATSPARLRSKKPPFNGSMFGKRSFAPALSRPSYVTKSMEYINSDSGDEDEENEYGGSAIETLAIKMTQDEPLIQASIDQCAQMLRSSGKEFFQSTFVLTTNSKIDVHNNYQLPFFPYRLTFCIDRDHFLATLCSKLLGNRVRENNLWIKQLLGLDRFYQ